MKDQPKNPLTFNEIAAWADFIPVERHLTAMTWLILLHDAIEDANLRKIRDLERSSTGIMARLCRDAAAEVKQGNLYRAAEPANFAEQRIFAAYENFQEPFMNFIDIHRRAAEKALRRRPTGYPPRCPGVCNIRRGK